MTAIGKKALEMFDNGMDTKEISNITGFPENVVVWAMEEELVARKKKERRKQWKQPDTE